MARGLASLQGRVPDRFSSNDASCSLRSSLGFRLFARPRLCFSQSLAMASCSIDFGLAFFITFRPTPFSWSDGKSNQPPNRGAVAPKEKTIMKTILKNSLALGVLLALTGIAFAAQPAELSAPR